MDLVKCGFSREWATLVYFSDASGIRLVEQYTQDWAAEIETKERYEFYSSFKCIFQSEKYINYQQKRCFRDSYIQFRF